jgi:uncharacterized protein YggE
MKTLFRSAVMAAALLGTTAVSAQAQTMPAGHEAHMMAPRGTILTLSAYGETKVAPDMATVSLGVVTEAPTAAVALQQNAIRMTAVVNALKAKGVAEKDIQTSGLSISPQYTYRENQAPLLRGYQVSNMVTVIVYDLAKLGSVVDATVSAGGNQMNGISFGLRDPQKAEDAARLEAVKRLQAKADLYSRAVGKPIKGLKSLSEGGGYNPGPTPPPMLQMRAVSAEAKMDTSVSAGELSVRVDVQGVYELVE